MIIRALHNATTRSPDGSESGGPAAATPAVLSSTVATTEPAAFSVDYVRELRAENKGYRLKAQQLEAAAATAATAAASAAADRSATEGKTAADTAAALQKAADDMAVRVSEVSAAAAIRLVRSEVRAGAAASGLAHPDFLKLLDTSAIVVGEDGEVVVPADFWTDAKAKFGHLFHTTGAGAGGTTSTSAPPKPAATAAKHASEMTDAEADAALSAIIGSHRR